MKSVDKREKEFWSALLPAYNLVGHDWKWEVGPSHERMRGNWVPPTQANPPWLPLLQYMVVHLSAVPSLWCLWCSTLALALGLLYSVVGVTD
jgi:hypothetical protein